MAELTANKKNSHSLEGSVIALVDDDRAAARVYAKWIEAAGAKVCVFHSFSEVREATEGPNGWAVTQKDVPDVFLTDLILPDGTGIDVVTLWRKHYPHSPVLVLTAFATVENAVEAMKIGAFDFLRKPLQGEELVLVLRRAYEHGKLIRENETLSTAVRIFGMAQTLSTIQEKFGLLKTFGRLLHREVKAVESFVFLYNADKKQMECLLECRVPGVPRNPPESVISSLLFHFMKSAPTSHSDKFHLEDTCPPNVTLHKQGKSHIMLVELRSPSGNSAFVALYENGDNPTFQTRKEELYPIVLQAARAFQNADATEIIANRSYIDELTGLYNQGYLELTLNNEIARSDRYGTPVSLLFFDLDKFKSVNDKHGHLAGSQILREAAKILRQNVRDSDILLRYGGDEFVAILPNTRTTGAQILADRIRESFDSMRFDVRAATQIPSAYDLHVTTSIGIACYPETASSSRSLILRADEAMYEAKHQGKNRVVCATPPKHDETREERNGEVFVRYTLNNNKS